jgi:hypothetical protein
VYLRSSEPVPLLLIFLVPLRLPPLSASQPPSLSGLTVHTFHGTMPLPGN